MNSIMQEIKECYICGRRTGLHYHHIYFGNPLRSISDKNGFTCFLCADHHTGTNGVHNNHYLDVMIKKDCQRKYELDGGSRKDFMKLIGRNYIFED